jgi:signal transduction histidine kinase
MTASLAADDARVLIVDDTPEIRLLLRRWIDRIGGFSVVADVGDGRSGVDAALAHQPEIVLLDLAMPVMDGLEALPLIRRVSPHSQVIVLSGFESTAMSRAALQRGAVAYLQKGAPMAELSELLSQVAGAPPRAPQPEQAVAELVGAAPQAPSADRSAARAELGRMYSALSVAAHELRGPAGLICAIAELLGSAPTGANAELIAAIRAQCQVIEQVTADLVITTKARRNDLAVDAQNVEVLPQLRHATAAVSGRVDVLITCPVGLTVHADEVRLQQMLGNLISNAVKYGEPPVRIVAQPGSRHVEIRVIDAGPGVPDDFRDVLFEPFARAAGRSVSGTGLGLYVVRALAERHGGRAWYESAPNGDSAFCFTLPVGS